MNSIEAKKLNLPEIMSRLGYEPLRVKKNGNEYWYNSPFRNEKDASFHTSFLGGKWIWNDFADKGGTVIDFIMRHENYLKVSDALHFLDRMYSKGGYVGTSKNINKSSSFQKHITKEETEPNKELKFISATPIQNPLIISYLTKERGINRQICLEYLEEVKYKNLNNQKNYFAFGIKNQSDGYEIRVASDKYPFKSSLLQKDITLIKGYKSDDKEAEKALNIFEGMTDFLSTLTILKSQNLNGDSLILHSLSFYEKSVELIKEQGYSAVNTFLDNDKSGKEFTEQYKSDLGNIVITQNHRYKGFKDVNDLLQHEKLKNLRFV
jgi:hypothetical protein